MMEIEEIVELEDKIRLELDEHLEEILVTLNRKGQLADLLKLLGCESLIEKDPALDVLKNGKIYVLGATEVKEEKLLAVAKELGLEKDRFVMNLTYDIGDCLSTLEFNYMVSAIMVGPLPHSGKGKGDSSSMISEMERKRDRFAPVIRLGTSELKITKSDFKLKLESMLERGVITV